MFGVVNPWLLVGALSAILASFFGGLSAGKDIERSNWLERESQHAKQVEKETDLANSIAIAYGQELNSSQEKATKLRRDLNESRKKLSTCADGSARLTDDFVRLRDAAMQADSKNSGQPSSQADGAGIDPAEIVEIDIENGRRWKACRGQLNSLIDILGGNNE